MDIEKINPRLADMPKRKAFCDKHGEYISRKIGGLVWSKCSQCLEEKIVIDEQMEREKQKKDWENKLIKSGIFDKFHNKTLDVYIANNPGQKEVLAFAMGYIRDLDFILKNGRNAIFIGNKGTGKNHIATGIGLYFLKKNKTVLFTTVVRAIRKIKDSWKSRDITEEQVVQYFVVPDLLVIDEIGVQYGTETERILLFDIINERYDRNKSTIMISNYTPDEVRAYVGENIIDRFSDGGGEVKIFDWGSYRK
jgi:DNA replication protein DnaC